jgi:hypothetical protein
MFHGKHAARSFQISGGRSPLNRELTVRVTDAFGGAVPIPDRQISTGVNNLVRKFSVLFWHPRFRWCGLFRHDQESDNHHQGECSSHAGPSYLPRWQSAAGRNVTVSATKSSLLGPERRDFVGWIFGVYLVEQFKRLGLIVGLELPLIPPPKKSDK